MSSWHNYPKIYALGHAALTDLLADDVVVEEKVDGSQFSFGVFDGELRCRSKGKELVLDAPEKMFLKAIETVRELQPLLRDGWTYRGEYLQKPKHNVLAYDRVPAKNIVLFDVNTGEEAYLPPEEKQGEASRLGLECVPILHFGRLESLAWLQGLLARASVLGGAKIEGVVVKSRTRFGADGKALMGKFVSEEFKEVHAGEWRVANPLAGDVIADLISRLRTPARWQKAVQHLRERGALTESPKDIGSLIREVQTDTGNECLHEIHDALWAWAWPKIERGIIAGLPQWYKEELAKMQFINKELLNETEMGQCTE